jgi:hypothetical protein
MRKLKSVVLAVAIAFVALLAGLGFAVLLYPKKVADWANGPTASNRIASPASAEPSPSPTAAADGSTFSKRLAAAGVKSCLSRIDELGKGVMGGVTSYFPASNWNVEAPDKHLASVLLGQKYDNPKLPSGFAALFGAPNGSDGCDGVSVQVLPSPIDCPTLQQDILKRGKLIGDLAGVPFIQDVSSQVALVATSANTCVMVSIHSAFAGKP